jgi:spore maturation protein CgeB
MGLLDSNLDALRQSGSDLPDRLTDPTTSDHLDCRDDGKVLLRIHRTLVSLHLPEASIQHILDGLPEAPSEILLFGLGLGEVLEELLLVHSQTRIVAWERDPAILAIVLSQVDCAEAILEGRLQLILGSDLREHRPGSDTTVLIHPLLRQIYWREQEWMEGDPERPIAVIAAGTLFVDDLSHALLEEGMATWTLDLLTHSRSELNRTLTTMKPRAVAAINYTLGLAELCTEHALPLLVWEIDPSIDPVRAPTRTIEGAHIFSWCRSNIDAWKKAGFTSAHYLPLAANPAHRTPLTLTRAEKGRYEAEICFVGSSLLRQVVEFRNLLRGGVGEWLRRNRKDPDQAGPIIDAILMHQREKLSRYVIPDLVEGAMPGFLAEMKALKQRFDPVALLGELAAAERRLSVVASLGDQGIQVWGDPGWRSVQKYGVRFRGSAGHRDELTRIYNAASIHIDIGRIYQLDIVTMRVFDVISCGGFLIAERNDAVLELFEDGVEIETWVTVEGLKNKCRYYLEHPERAAEIANRGRRRLLEDHSIRHRLQEMLAVSGALR